MANLPVKSKSLKPTTAPAKKPKFRFFSQLVEELRKVHWPTRQEAARLSMLVLIVCVIIGAILGALDFAFTKLFTNVFLGG